VRLRKLTALLILVCLLLSMTSSTALAKATQNGNRISATTDDWREVAASYSAMEAEIGALRETIFSERQKTMEIITTTNDLRASDAKEIQLLKQQIGLTSKVQYRKGFSNGFCWGLATALAGVVIAGAVTK